MIKGMDVVVGGRNYGKTRRMLLDSFGAALDGDAVKIVCPNEKSKKWVEAKIKASIENITVYVPGEG